MRDIGTMGEATFSLWCADTGLIANSSQIDKTGWDFFVEFPLENESSSQVIHHGAIECKVQVKSTDKNDRKVQITLSNLRRLITAQMPTFFVFIEFNGENSAQAAFVVHVDNTLISKVLRLLHKIEQSDQDNKFNKRKMTIHYDSTHEMDCLDGDCLKTLLESHIGNNVANYIASKKLHLESSGFEDGSTLFRFQTEGKDDLNKLIDASIGIGKSVAISNFYGTHMRFGILNKSPFIDSTTGRIEIRSPKPYSLGTLRFKEDNLSPGLLFSAKLYISPFNAMVPEQFRKIRIEGKFFDIVIHPFTGETNYSFSVGGGVRLAVHQFRDAIKLLSILATVKNRILIVLDFESIPKCDLQIGRVDQDFCFSKELKALGAAVNIISNFGINEFIDISFFEVSKYEIEICQLEQIITNSLGLVRVEFKVVEKDFNPTNEMACISLISAPIGSHIFGIFLVIIGKATPIENNYFRLETENVILEKKIVSRQDQSISHEELVEARNQIITEYEKEYITVVIL